MRRATLVVLSGVFIALVAGSWAAPLQGAARLPSSGAQPSEISHARASSLPSTVTFRDIEGRGLLVRAWINNHGPYNFAVDTGAGMTLLTESLAREAGLQISSSRSTVIAGLSGRELAVGKTTVDRIALGYSGNIMPARISVALVPNLPNGVDGILDPSDVYAPFGFSIDLPRREISAFDPATQGLNSRQQPVAGAVVPWVRDGYSKRPFVRLNDGRLALIDTGSEFGLALSTGGAARRNTRNSTRDIGGGAIQSTRVAPSNVSIGSLVLQEIPTDILDGVAKGAPVILGRDALYPFKLSFDPAKRLIEIAPSVDNRN